MSDLDIDKLKSSIRAHEGSRFYVYDDATGMPITSGTTVVGNPTIGVGRLLTQAKGISSDEIGYLLDHDIQSVLEQAQQQIWWPHVEGNDARGRAMVELCFNLGCSGVRAFTHAIDCLCNDDFAGSAREFLDSKWAAQVGSRANVLATMIETGVDS